MDRRKFLGVGAAVGAGVAAAPAMAAAPASLGTMPTHELAETLNQRFAKTQIRFDPIARSGKNRVYVTLTTTGRDYFGRQKVGGGWHYDLDTMAWSQQKPWISPGTEAQYTKLVEKAQKALLAAL